MPYATPPSPDYVQGIEFSHFPCNLTENYTQIFLARCAAESTLSLRFQLMSTFSGAVLDFVLPRPISSFFAALDYAGYILGWKLKKQKCISRALAFMAGASFSLAPTTCCCQSFLGTARAPLIHTQICIFMTKMLTEIS